MLELPRVSMIFHPLNPTTSGKDDNIIFSVPFSLFWALDPWCQVLDAVTLQTYSHRLQQSKTWGVNPHGLVRFPVGNDDQLVVAVVLVAVDHSAPRKGASLSGHRYL